MTVTMGKFPGTGISICAAAALAATLWSWPALGSDLGSDTPSAVAAAAVASGDRVGPVSPSAAMAWALQGRPKPARSHRIRPARVAALSQQGCGWYASPCDRQFVLILGIGF